MITIFHTGTAEYYRSAMAFLHGRPATAAEAKGHGIKKWGEAGQFTGASAEDGIIYYPSDVPGEEPDSGNDRHVRYQLIDMMGPHGLWAVQMRELYQPLATHVMFGKWGNFLGDCRPFVAGKSCSENSANAPWNGSWSDGRFALDPARLFKQKLPNIPQLSEYYANNPYLRDLKGYFQRPQPPPDGFPSIDVAELYARNGHCP